MIPVCAGVVCVSFFTCLVLCFLFRRLSLAVGHVDRPDGVRKVHASPVPYGGGPAVIATVAAAYLGVYAAAHLVPEAWFPAAVRVHLPGLRTAVGRLFLVGGGGLLVGLMGFIDDVFPLRETLKLLVHLSVAVAMWLLGFRITAHLPFWPVSLLLTVLWIAGISNAFNFLDNMDGLSGGVAAIVCLLFAGFSLRTGQIFVACYFLILAGAALAFLVYNFPPARLFLGDCGSLFLGFMIAMGAVVSTFAAGGSGNRFMPLLAPILICSLPIFDAFSVVFIRLSTGRPLLKADRNHFSHRLLTLGMSPRTVLLTIYLVVAGVGLSGFYLVRLNTADSFIALGQAVLVFGVIVLIERAGRSGGGASPPVEGGRDESPRQEG